MINKPAMVIVYRIDLFNLIIRDSACPSLVNSGKLNRLSIFQLLKCLSFFFQALIEVF